MFSWGHFYVSLNNPAIEPLGEAVSNVEMFRRLSERMGSPSDWSSRTESDAPRRRTTGLLHVGGHHDGPAESGGLGAPQPAPGRPYAPYAEGGFPTASGKCEFKSSLAELAGNLVVPVFREGYNEFQPGGTVDPLPHYVPPRDEGRTLAIRCSC